MKYIRLATLLMGCWLLMAACEKTISSEDEKEKQKQEQTGDDEEGDEEDDGGGSIYDQPVTPTSEDEYRSVTVEQAIHEVGYDEWIIVTGYIVGCAYRKIDNISFYEPFKGKSNILLADKFEEEFNLYDVEEEYFPVYIGEFKPYQNDLNLEDHPELLGKRIRIWGRKDLYFGVDGLRNMLNYEFVDPPTEE